ncbi:SOS response-associated peptidase [Agromyces mangrovi Wang et al. 2018]|uniref:SOS response-associated peptidase n=1 Tax=Agromyces mangrovi TaxID=1858653 RepID=UPI00257325BB|nr:SOS response-associated peptidase [Agromyces mangrovi]
MCGRFAMDDETNDLIEAFVLDGNDFRDWDISYSIAPTDVVPIIRERQDRSTGEVRRTVVPAIWDFHPSFLREAKRPQFNARIETVATNGLWKGAFASSRCIVPMRGYYEWTGKPGDKQAHFLHGDGLLAAAGIATARKVDDEWQVSTAIITRAAKDASGEVHDRMPAFLLPDRYDEWLDATPLDDDGRRAMVDLLGEVSDRVAETIASHEVDRRVNNSRTADPSDASLIEPLEP